MLDLTFFIGVASKTVFVPTGLAFLTVFVMPWCSALKGVVSKIMSNSTSVSSSDVLEALGLTGGPTGKKLPPGGDEMSKPNSANKESNS